MYLLEGDWIMQALQRSADQFPDEFISYAIQGQVQVGRPGKGVFLFLVPSPSLSHFSLLAALNGAHFLSYLSACHMSIWDPTNGGQNPLNQAKISLSWFTLCILYFFSVMEILIHLPRELKTCPHKSLYINIQILFIVAREQSGYFVIEIRAYYLPVKN